MSSYTTSGFTLYMRQETREVKESCQVVRTEEVIQAYSDEECTNKMAAWPIHYRSRPYKNVTKTYRVNCTQWQVVWK